jgi:PhoH-like ATPase
MAKKNFIIDTSVFLSDANCIYKLQNNDVFIPLKVLEEIDLHKKRQDTVGHHARQAIRIFDSLRGAGSLSKGVRIDKGLGMLRVIKASEIALSELPRDLTHKMSDHLILATALTVKSEYPKRKTVVISRDINMRVIADSLGLLTEDYNNSQVVENTDKIYEGFTQLLVDEELINQFYLGDPVYLDEDVVSQQGIKLHWNEFVMLVSSSNEKKTALSRFSDYIKPLRHIRDLKNELMWGILPRNKEQSFAFDLLFDDDIPLVSLIGKAGSGKTLMAIAAALEQGLGGKGDQYRRIIISRPVQPLGKDIGFLPGTLEEKMLPWLKPIQDNIRHLMGDDRTMLEAYVEKGKIEVEALTYIRGRSISNAFVIIDEAQNLTAHEVKTIITRIGENTKIVLTGDIEQIDNVYTNETSNGLTYAVEKFKESELAGHITFRKGERSKLATAAAKLL